MRANGETRTKANDFISVKPDRSLISPTKWAWRNRIVQGGLTLLVGNEEVGKGVFVIYLMSKLSRGTLVGCYEGHPVPMKVLAYEDSQAEWNKRMDAAGVDEQMWSFTLRRDGTVIDFTEDVDALIWHWRKEGTKFVYIDQLQDHIGAGTDSYNNKEVRNALLPLQKALTDAGITAIATLHPNKGGSSVREKVNGSIGTLAIVRSAMYVARHPDDEKVRVVVQIKNNRGPRAGAKEFEIEDTDRHYRPNGRYVQAPVINELRDSVMTFEDLMGRGQTRKGELDRRIRVALADGEWHWFSDLRADGFPKSEFSFNVMKRAAARLGVRVEQVGMPARSRWRLERESSRAPALRVANDLKSKNSKLRQV